jgi:tricorn protease
MVKRWISTLALILFFSQLATAQQAARRRRFPDIHGDRVVFVYAGDLWTASTKDGVARRPTPDKGHTCRLDAAQKQ